jgi:hypothetical protein
MQTKFINGFGELARVFDRIAIEVGPMIDLVQADTARIVEKHIKDDFGDTTRLAALSQYTQDDRVSMGYSPDEPLLRDGTLLRDQVVSAHAGPVAEVGSPEPVQLYSENGFVNARTGTSVPPRPVFRDGALDSKHDVVTAFEDAIGILLR